MYIYKTTKKIIGVIALLRKQKKYFCFAEYKLPETLCFNQKT